MTYVLTWSPLYTAVLTLPRWLPLSEVFFLALGNWNLGHGHIMKWKQSCGFKRQLSVNGKRKGDPVRVQDCSGKCRVWEVMGLSEWWVYSIRKNESHFLERNFGCTYCHCPWGDDCKIMVRNKQTFSVHGLMPFMRYYSVLFPPQKSPVTDGRQHTKLSLIWNPTIPTSSLFHCEHLLSIYLLLWLFNGLIHTIKWVLLRGQWATGVKSSWQDHHCWLRPWPWTWAVLMFSWWVHRSQFLVFLC